MWTNLGLAALAAGFSGCGALWAAAAAGARLTGHPVPSEGVGGAISVLVHPLANGTTTGLEAAWGGPVGPAWLFWTLTVAIAAAVAGVVVVGWRLLRTDPDPYKQDPESWPGMATRAQVAAAAGPKALQARSSTLRPSLAAAAGTGSRRGHGVELREVGFRVGSSRGVDCLASVEDSVIVVGPPRSGKGLHLVISTILDAPGAVVTTSTRPDNLAATITARAAGADGRPRPVLVFDPEGLAPGASDLAGPLGAAKWSPIRGCEDPGVAMARARALIGGPAADVENASHWSDAAEDVMQGLLHAAALDGREPYELYEWSRSAVAAQDALTILREHPAATPGWAVALNEVLTADSRYRDSVWSSVSRALKALANPRVLAAVSPGPGEEFDPYEFIRGSGTAYLIGTASGAGATARLVATFIEDLVEAARRIAAGSTGFRLDPPLTLVLDEAANYPLPSLPALMSEGGGSGISTWVFLQSLAQARSQWGNHDADAIWDSAIVKVILGGGGHADDLGDLSQLLGTRKVNKSSTSYGGTGHRSVSEHVEDRPILEAAHIRRIAFGYALMVPRASAPIMLKLTRWTERRDAAALTTARDQVTEAIHRAALAAGMTTRSGGTR